MHGDAGPSSLAVRVPPPYKGDKNDNTLHTRA